MPHVAMAHDADPRKLIWDALGNIDDFELLNTQVLCAIYKRPEKTASGLYMPDSHRAEDTFQSKIGLIVAVGATAFIEEDPKWFDGKQIDVGDWVVFRPSDGWNISVNKVECRILNDVHVRARVKTPDQAW